MARSDVAFSAEMRCLVVALILIFALSTPLRAQPDSSAIDKKRLRTLIITAGLGYSATLVTLNHVWYQNTERQSFRFFNDNAEWKQADKAGHFFGAYFLADLSARALKNCGVRESRSDAIGAISGLLLTLPIEIFDGYSDGYGASVGDVLADAAGPAFFLGQKLLWREVRIYPKFSFHRSGYAPLRPDLLGDDLLSEVVKDYNGQTQWLSVDVDKFTAFPKWLNIAVGYGAEDMIYARDHENKAAGYDPYRQYYLAIDFDLTSVKTRSKWIKSLLYVINAIHLPAPALEISRKGSRFRPFYF